MVFVDVTGPPPANGGGAEKYANLKAGLVGSMLNITGVDRVRKLQEIAVKETRLGIPLIFGHDVIHGFKTLAPIPLAEAASWDLKAIEKSASVARYRGICGRNKLDFRTDGRHFKRRKMGQSDGRSR
jgi:beta-glucosidase